jgi:hypothetical protein
VTSHCHVSTQAAATRRVRSVENRTLLRSSDADATAPADHDAKRRDMNRRSIRERRRAADINVRSYINRATVIRS